MILSGGVADENNLFLCTNTAPSAPATPVASRIFSGQCSPLNMTLFSRGAIHAFNILVHDVTKDGLMDLVVVHYSPLYVRVLAVWGWGLMMGGEGIGICADCALCQLFVEAGW